LAADLPSDYGTQAEYATYYKALGEAACTCTEQIEMDSHEAMLALVPRSDATAVFAVDSGEWGSAGNWYPVGVPGTDDKVLIGEGTVCT
jgi:hypothetical protein